MYNPAAFAVDSSDEIVSMLRQVPFGHLVTSVPASDAASGLTATALPFVIDDNLSTVRAHFARANQHWREIHESSALFIVPGVDAYVSPRWYPSKAEHGKVVPTWNYEVVHLHGTIEIHDDAEWKLNLVSELTDFNEATVGDPDRRDAWKVSDAPSDFIDGQLKAIVGVQLNVTAIDAKRKLSQNREDADRLGAMAGLGRSDRPGDVSTATVMERLAADATKLTEG